MVGIKFVLVSIFNGIDVMIVFFGFLDVDFFCFWWFGIFGV